MTETPEGALNVEAINIAVQDAIAKGGREGFQEGYRTAKTWAELEEVIKHTLSAIDIRDLIDGLKQVKFFTGLDMRQDFLLGLLKSLLVEIVG